MKSEEIQVTEYGREVSFPYSITDKDLEEIGKDPSQIDDEQFQEIAAAFELAVQESTQFHLKEAIEELEALNQFKY